MSRRPTCLAALPPTFNDTVLAVHTLAEHVLCVPRFEAVGRVGLVAAPNGVQTPPFGPDDRVVGVDGADLIDRNRDGERRTAITDLRGAADFFGCEVGVPGKLWKPVTAPDLDARLAVDATAVTVLAAWFRFVDEALDELRLVGVGLGASTLWPEGFDLAATADDVNFGGSPGDRFVDQPYLYVAPFDRDLPVADPPYWNATFGASLRYQAIGSIDEATAFLRRGHLLVVG